MGGGTWEGREGMDEVEKDRGRERERVEEWEGGRGGPRKGEEQRREVGEEG